MEMFISFSPSTFQDMKQASWIVILTLNTQAVQLLATHLQ